jgi:hypothetical protein
MGIHNRASLNQNQTAITRRKRLTENRRQRWECEIVQLIATPVDSTEWQYLLETLARELYDLGHQLQEAVPVVQTRLGENTRSYSLHHPERTETQTPTDASVGEGGVRNGKEPYQPAA